MTIVIKDMFQIFQTLNNIFGRIKKVLSNCLTTGKLRTDHKITTNDVQWFMRNVFGQEMIPCPDQ